MAWRPLAHLSPPTPRHGVLYPTLRILPLFALGRQPENLTAMCNSWSGRGRILPEGPQTTMSKGFPRNVLLAHRLISSRQAFRATAPSGLRRRPARTLRPRLGRARRHPTSRIWSPGWPPLSLPNPSKASVTASVAPCVQTPTPDLLPPRHPAYRDHLRVKDVHESREAYPKPDPRLL